MEEKKKKVGLLECIHQCCVSVIARGVNIRFILYEQLGHLCVAAIRCMHKFGVSIFVPSVYVGSCSTA